MPRQAEEPRGHPSLRVERHAVLKEFVEASGLDRFFGIEDREAEPGFFILDEDKSGPERGVGDRQESRRIAEQCDVEKLILAPPVGEGI